MELNNTSRDKEQKSEEMSKMISQQKKEIEETRNKTELETRELKNAIEQLEKTLKEK